MTFWDYFGWSVPRITQHICHVSVSRKYLDSQRDSDNALLPTSFLLFPWALVCIISENTNRYIHQFCRVQSPKTVINNWPFVKPFLKMSSLIWMHVNQPQSSEVVVKATHYRWIGSNFQIKDIWKYLLINWRANQTSSVDYLHVWKKCITSFWNYIFNYAN